MYRTLTNPLAITQGEYLCIDHRCTQPNRRQKNIVLPTRIVSFFLSRFWFFFTLLILSLSRYFSPGSHPPPPQKEYFAKYIYPWEIKIMFTYLGQLLVLFYHILNFLFQVFNLKLYIHIFLSYFFVILYL